MQPLVALKACWIFLTRHHSVSFRVLFYACRHEGSITAALKQYESLRHTRAAALLQHSRRANSVANLQSPLAAAARDVLLRGIVRVQGTIPSDWLWQYDCEAAVT
jgi:2-polyprenyl-6-methoxyphenol hydroxylase-like FAD-dependent oxidoreductase